MIGVVAVVAAAASLVAPKLPPLPPRGLAVEAQGRVVLETIHGQRLVSLETSGRPPPKVAMWGG